MIRQNISAEVEAISDNLMIIRSKFKPLMFKEIYAEDVDRLVDAVGGMLENVESMAWELENAFEILSEVERT